MHRPLITHAPIGFRRDGRPIFPVAGGAEGDPPPDPPKLDPKPDPPKTFEQADVDRIVSERLAREREKFADVAEAREKAKKYDELQAASASDVEKALTKGREEGRSEATKAAHDQFRRTEARALAAAAKFRDPTDAVAFLDLDDVKVSEDGTVDAAAVKARLEQLAKDKPYLLADDKPGKPTPDKSQGAREKGGVSGKDAGKAEAERRFGKVGAQQ